MPKKYIDKQPFFHMYGCRTHRVIAMASSKSSKVMQHILPNIFTLLISVLFAPLCQFFSSLGTKLRNGLKNWPGQKRIVVFSLFSNRMIRISSVVALLSIITTVLIPRISFQSSKAHTLVQTAVRFYLQRWHRKRKPLQTLLQWHGGDGAQCSIPKYLIQIIPSLIVHSQMWSTLVASMVVLQVW